MNIAELKFNDYLFLLSEIQHWKTNLCLSGSSYQSYGQVQHHLYIQQTFISKNVIFYQIMKSKNEKLHLKTKKTIAGLCHS